MVRNIKMNWGTRRWIRRHRRRHGNDVLVRKHRRHVSMAERGDPFPLLVAVDVGTAHCACGASRPAYGTVTRADRKEPDTDVITDGTHTATKQWPRCDPPNVCVLVGTRCEGRDCAIRARRPDTVATT